MRKAAAGLPHSKSLLRNIVRDSVGTARARNVFVSALRSIRGRSHFLLIGHVGMPEHVYMLISEAPKCTPSLVLKVLKQRVARDLRKRRRRLAKGQLSLAFKEGKAE